MKKFSANHNVFTFISTKVGYWFERSNFWVLKLVIIFNGNCCLKSAQNR